MNFTRSLLFCCGLLSGHLAHAQSGCTDPQATNYNPSAVTNDGSCIYPVTHKTPLLRGVLNPIITESSGLEWTDGKLWTHNDSGNPPDIFSIDTTDGHTLQRIVIDNYPNVDWEDITADSNYIYIGDHGNNHGSRTDLKVLKVAKSDITSDTVVHVNAQAISFSYADQTNFTPSSTNNFDCEALVSISDSLYIFTKDRGDGQTRVYQMPKTPGTYSLAPYTGYNVDGLITGADYNATTNEIVLIGYFSGHIKSFLWYLSDFQGHMFFSGNKRRIEIGGGAEWQTEGVAFLSNNRIFISCETTDSIPASLYLSDNIFANTTQVSMNPELKCTIYPNPANATLYINGLMQQATYRILNVSGQRMQAGSLDAGNNIISTKDLVPANYFIELSGIDGNTGTMKFEKQ